MELSEQFGVDVVVYENEDEIEHEVAKDAVRNGDLVEAYTTGNKVYFVASSFVGRGGIRRAEEVFVHEVVVHIGLEKLLGDKWTQFRSDIWQKMNKHEQRVFMEYAKDTNPNMSENELQLLAADEYLAHLSERFASDVLTPHEASVFDEIINFFMQIMETLGIRLSNQQCKTIFVASAQAMREAKESRDKANTESKPKETKDQTESKTKEKSDKEVKEEGNKENAKPKKNTDEVKTNDVKAGGSKEQTGESNERVRRKKKQPSLQSVALNKKEQKLKPVLTGINHLNGYAIATDEHIMVADKRLYDPELEGKAELPDGKVMDGHQPMLNVLSEIEKRDFHAKIDMSNLAEVLEKNELKNTSIKFKLPFQIHGRKNVYARSMDIKKFVDFANANDINEISFLKNGYMFAKNNDISIILMLSPSTVAELLDFTIQLDDNGGDLVIRSNRSRYTRFSISRTAEEFEEPKDKR